MHRVLRFLLAPIFALHMFVAGCAGFDTSAALRTANTVASGVACGVAAAQGTPCTPGELLTQLAAAQRALIEMAAAQAAQDNDPAVVDALLRGLEASSATQRALADQVIRLAEKAAGPAVTPAPARAPEPKEKPKAPTAPEPALPPAAPPAAKPEPSPAPPPTASGPSASEGA